LIVSHATTHQMFIRHIDIKTAYLNSDLNKTIYMSQPCMFDRGNGMVCKLNKAIYGFKQAARCWNERLTAVLSDLDLKPLFSDSCIFGNEDRSLIVAFYVDDLLIVSDRKSSSDSIVDRLKNILDLTDKGELSNYLGMDFVHNGSKLEISQVNYIRELLDRFMMTDCKVVATPIASIVLSFDANGGAESA
jgi:hypothetical protein